MYFTGFADEAAPDIDGQIKATLALGWTRIESRNIDGTNIHDISEAAFDVVSGKLRDAGIQINCFGSAIANWGRSIVDPHETSIADTRRAIPRMLKLGTRMIRIMSFSILADRSPDDQMERERFARLREICGLFTSEGILPVHENCNCYGGMGWKYTQRMLENVPGMKLVFDTGNPLFTPDYQQPEPRPMQSAWEFYKHVKQHIAYVHIKDGRVDPVTGQHHFVFPGEGVGDVRRIVTDLCASGYAGGWSIEPHMKVVQHDPSVTSTAELMFDNYVEYGRRFMKLLDERRSLAVQSLEGGGCKAEANIG